MNIGYARVSTTGQSLDVQLEQLTQAGCERIFQEKMSGTTTDGREALENALLTLRDGDVLVVTRLDRLARSVADLHGLVQRIVGTGAAFACIQQGGVDTATSSGKLMLSILGAVAEFENDIRRERQRDGIEKAKLDGRYHRGRAKSIDREKVKRETIADRSAATPLGPAELARQLGISRSAYYRIVGELEAAGELERVPPLE